MIELDCIVSQGSVEWVSGEQGRGLRLVVLCNREAGKGARTGRAVSRMAVQFHLGRIAGGWVPMSREADALMAGRVRRPGGQHEAELQSCSGRISDKSLLARGVQTNTVAAVIERDVRSRSAPNAVPQTS